MEKYLYVIVGLLISLSIEFYLRRKYGIGFFKYRPVNHVHQWAERILFAGFVIVIFFGVYFYGFFGGMLAVFMHMLSIQFLRGYMEHKKGLPESKEYIFRYLQGSYMTVFTIGLLILIL